MTDIQPVLPRAKAPDLAVPTVGGGHWRLADSHPQTFTLVVFYRGLHCPLCKAQLKDLESKLPEFDKRGVTVVAVSADDAERASTAVNDWGLEKLTIGYDMPLDVARSWGLYISSTRGTTSAKIEEPHLFSEPGLFLVKPDNTVFFVSVQSMPFARPHLSDVLSAVDFVLAKDYPARGEIADLKTAEAA
ncbi:peroxiredoxin-like family protein [Tepidamorphus sp. 3E244]|uniref:peroxiredoxin-like family protein n=1 Tax=Tepidamorphus sp. 3E244 TaxID=3385498 RepID=UPI0038FCD399